MKFNLNSSNLSFTFDCEAAKRLMAMRYQITGLEGVERQGRLRMPIQWMLGKCVGHHFHDLKRGND